MKILLILLSKPLFAGGILSGLMTYRVAEFDAHPALQVEPEAPEAILEQLVIPIPEQPEIAPQPGEAPEPAQPEPGEAPE